MSKYEKLGGSEEVVALRELTDTLSGGALTASLEASMKQLVVALQEAEKSRERGLQELTGAIKESSGGVDLQPLIDKMGAIQQKPLDVKGLLEGVAKLTQKETIPPTYQFEVERNHSGLLTGLRAVPVAPNGDN